MADYSNYNQSAGGKGPIVAICVLAALIIGLLYLGVNAPRVQDGAVSLDPASASSTVGETAPATGAIAPAVTE